MSIQMRVIQLRGWDEERQEPCWLGYDIQYRTAPDGPWTTVPMVITDSGEAYQRMRDGGDQ